MSVVLATQAGLEARAIPRNTVNTVQYQGGLEARAHGTNGNRACTSPPPSPAHYQSLNPSSSQSFWGQFPLLDSGWNSRGDCFGERNVCQSPVSQYIFHFSFTFFTHLSKRGTRISCESESRRDSVLAF